MNDEEFKNFLKLKYRRGDQIPQVFVTKFEKFLMINSPCVQLMVAIFQVSKHDEIFQLMVANSEEVGSRGGPMQYYDLAVAPKIDND